MRKSFLLLIPAIFYFTVTNAQISASKSADDGDETFGKKGDQTINVYYGVSLLNSIYKSVAAANSTDLKFSSLGPVGIVYEYFIDDKIGLGCELGYARFRLSYNYEGFTSSSTNQQIHSDTWDFTTIRAMFRANFHFVKNKEFDGYGFVSSGYRSTTFTFSSTNPDNTGVPAFRSIIPFGFKPGLGFRYFFIPAMGINVEFALGAPLLSGGLSFKF